MVTGPRIARGRGRDNACPDQASFRRDPNQRASIKPQRERDAVRAGQQDPGLAGSDLELPTLRRAARELEGDLVVARRQIDLRAVRRLAHHLSGVRQPASALSWQRDGPPVDGDDGLFIPGVAEPQPRLPWPRQDAGSRGGGLMLRQVGDGPAVLMDEPQLRRSIGGRERGFRPVWRDDRAGVLAPAASAELGAIEAEHSRESERRLEVKRLDVERVLRRRDEPGLGPRQAGGGVADA